MPSAFVPGPRNELAETERQPTENLMRSPNLSHQRGSERLVAQARELGEQPE